MPANPDRAEQVARKIVWDCIKCGMKFEPRPWQIRQWRHVCRPCWAVKNRAYKRRPEVNSRIREYLRRMNRDPKSRAARKNRESRPEFRERQALRQRLRYQNPIEAEKHKARAATQWAIKGGRLVKRPCERCGSKKSQAHHHDYKKPLEVTWLCRTHHNEVHHGN